MIGVLNAVVTWTDVVVAGATATQTVVVAAAAAWAFFQLREGQRSRRLAACLPVFERLDDERAVARRRQIYHEIAEAMPKLTERQVAVIEAVSNDFNFVGYLVTRELIEFELIADLYVDPVIRCWTVCEPFIREQQAVRSPLYGTHFYEFYKQCLRHRGTAQTDRASTTGAIDQPGFADGPAADPATRHD